MIVISLVLVIAAAVSLFVGLFVVTDSLTFIFLAIVLCLVSLVLLRLGTRAQKATGPSKPSEPVYGGVARAGRAAPARTGAGDADDTSAPSVVRKTTARDRAAARVADADVTVTTETAGAETAKAATAASAPAAAAADDAPTAAKTAPAKKAAKKAPAKKAAKKAPAKKAAKKAPAKKAPAEKATKKAATKKTTAGAKKTTGAAARKVLAGVSGVGPAKQDALLKQYKNLEGIREASVDDIVANVSGFGEALAKRVKDAVS